MLIKTDINNFIVNVLSLIDMSINTVNELKFVLLSSW